MKNQKNTLVFKSIVAFIFLSFTLFSCNQENLSINNEASLSQDLENAVAQTKIDDVSESIDDIIDNISIDFTNNNIYKNTETKKTDEQKHLPDCVIVTKVITDTGKKVTLDYGEECTTKNDNILSGKIVMNIYFNREEKSVNIDYTFDNFYFNNKKVEGEVHKNKLRDNENGNPEVTIKREIKITWEDDTFVTVTGERNREWVEGIRNGNWGDNVFLITGTWTITKKNGMARTATIIEALKRNNSCRFLVSGIIEIKKNDKIILLNYGDGTCDNKAIATIDGVEHEIFLKKRRI